MTKFSKWMLGAAVALTLATPVLADDDVVITKGKLSNVTDHMAEQKLSVKNNRTTMIGMLGVTCAFFRADEMVGKGGSLTLRVKPGETIYTQVGDIGTFGADRTVCRVEYATSE